MGNIHNLKGYHFLVYLETFKKEFAENSYLNTLAHR
jgi:hypothetical protein